MGHIIVVTDASSSDPVCPALASLSSSATLNVSFVCSIPSRNSKKIFQNHLTFFLWHNIVLLWTLGNVRCPKSHLAAYRLASPGSRLPAPGSRLPAPGSRLPAPGSRLPAPGSRLPTPDSRLPTCDYTLLKRRHVKYPALNSPVSYEDKPQVHLSSLQICQIYSLQNADDPACVPDESVVPKIFRGCYK
jgi:hypothetical protein